MISSWLSWFSNRTTRKNRALRRALGRWHRSPGERGDLGLEALEDRALLSVTAALSTPTDVTFTGNASADTLQLSTDPNGFLQHNRFTAGDAGYESDIDLDPTVVGDQTARVTLLTSLVVQMGDGDDVVRVGTLLMVEGRLDVDGEADVNEIQLTGHIRTKFDQVYHDPVVQVGDTTLQSDDTIELQSTLDGAFNFNFNALNNKTVGGDIGGNTPLTSLGMAGIGENFLNGSSVTTDGHQVYSTAVNLAVDMVFNGTQLDFQDAILGATTNLTLNGSDTTSLRSVSNVVDLVTTNGSQTLIYGDIVTTGQQAYDDQVLFVLDSTLSAPTTIIFQDTVDGVGNLGFDCPDVTFSQDVGGMTPLGSISSFDPAGVTTFQSGVIHSSKHQVYDSVVIVNDFSDIRSEQADITFTNRLDLNGNAVFTGRNMTFDVMNPLTTTTNLTFNTLGNGITTFTDTVGNTGAFQSLTTNADGTTVLATPAINLNGTGFTFNDPVLVAANSTITEIGLGNGTFNSTVDCRATEAGQFSLTVILNGGDGFINANVGGNSALAAFHFTGADDLTIDTSLIRTNGGQTFGGSVFVGTDIAFTSNAGGAITYLGTLDSLSSLTPTRVDIITAALIDLHGAVGGINPLDALTVVDNGLINNLFLRIGGGLIHTFGDQEYDAQVLLAADTILNTQDILFDTNSSVDSDLNSPPRGLTINTSLGGQTQLTFAGTNNPLLHFTTNADGVTVLRGFETTFFGFSFFVDAEIITVDDVTFNDRLEVVVGAEITANDITFNNTVDSSELNEFLFFDRLGSLQLFANSVGADLGEIVFGDDTSDRVGGNLRLQFLDLSADSTRFNADAGNDAFTEPGTEDLFVLRGDLIVNTNFISTWGVVRLANTGSTVLGTLPNQAATIRYLTFSGGLEINTPVIEIEADRVTVSNLTITGGVGNFDGDGIRFLGFGFEAYDNVNLTYLNITGNDRAGIDAGSDGSLHSNLLVQASTIQNNTFGIVLAAATNALIGGTGPVQPNRFLNNVSDAIAINNNDLLTGNRIQRNTYSGNGGLGIDLIGGAFEESDGSTPNDIPDALTADSDTGGNNLQNTPEITQSFYEPVTGFLEVKYIVPSATTSSAYPLTVELYEADNNTRQGKRLLAVVTYDATKAGLEDTVQINGVTGVALGSSYVTATATDANGNTSEFALAVSLKPFTVPPPALPPTPPNDPNVIKAPFQSGLEATYLTYNIAANALTLTIEKGATSSATFLSSTSLRQNNTNAVGTIVGTQIIWSDGRLWKVLDASLLNSIIAKATQFPFP